MSFEFKPVGRFRSEADAERWARENGVPLTDLNTRPGGNSDEVDAFVRADVNPENDWRDRPGGRRGGY